MAGPRRITSALRSLRCGLLYPRQSLQMQLFGG
jgi:hypothetical protein